MPLIKRAYADTPEGQVHYRYAGAGDPLILMHWCPSNGRQYEPVIPLFVERGYAVYAPDLMGYGDSDKPATQWRIEDYAANLGHFLDALGLERVFIVGGHTSAAITAEFAINNPSRVTRLVLDGCPAYTPEERARQAGAYTPPMKVTPEGDHMMWAWKRSYRRPEMPLERVYLAALDLLKAGYTYHVGYEAVFAYDMASRLPYLKVPTLVMRAEADPLFGKHKRVMELVPHAAEHTFPGPGPLSDPERAEEWVTPVDAFLRWKSE